MVQPDVAGQPLQQPRQLQVGAALHGRLQVLPAGVGLPVGVLELVLHVEEEDADHRGEVLDGQVDEQEGLPAKDGEDEGHQAGEGQVGPPDAGAHLGLVAAVAEGQPVAEHEDPDRPDQEHHPGVAVDAVAEALPGGGRQVLLGGHGVDVADAALVEVAAGGVVPGVGVLPVAVGGQGEHAAHEAQRVVGAGVLEEGAVAGVVLQDEDAHQEEGGGEVEEQGEPPVQLERAVGQVPQGQEGEVAGKDLPHTPHEGGLREGADQGNPVLGLDFLLWGFVHEKLQAPKRGPDGLP